jgi:hypothetical protein
MMIVGTIDGAHVTKHIASNQIRDEIANAEVALKVIGWLQARGISLFMSI